MSSNFQERFRFTFINADVILEGVSTATEEINKRYGIPVGTSFASVIMQSDYVVTENEKEVYSIENGHRMVTLFESIIINDTKKKKIYNLASILENPNDHNTKLIAKINDQLENARNGRM